MRVPSLILCLALAGTSPVLAQEHQHSPYAGDEKSDIPSLSPKELSDLRAGAGMGLARAAELNHYPGPKHVLELADSLGLSSEQERAVSTIREAMHARALELGERIIEAERSLGLRFRHGHIDSAAVREATANIGRLQGELRYRHLAAHLETRKILDARQIEAYDRLRGYVKE
jgi:hypothetical protein